ncbi:MAG: hypothetical protein SV583_07200 [Pseudomonadota bacterium]|nr:hypothetical protein [Pseudomonadota bacterium]
MRAWKHQIAGLTTALIATHANAVSLEFDFTYDTSGFFTQADALASLNAAGALFESRLQDSLAGIVPAAGESFEVRFSRPDTGVLSGVERSIAADTLVIYVGARELGGALGEGGPGGFSASSFGGGDLSASLPPLRGQTGPDFGPWGGAMTFDASADWYFGADAAGLGGGQSDFYSVALHEIAHVLGVGTSATWGSWVSGGEFSGPAVQAVAGGPVALTDDGGHFAEGTLSLVMGISQEAALDPNLTTGTRKHLTDLDWAALEDIGWEVAPVPLPAALWLLAAPLFGLTVWRRS